MADLSQTAADVTLSANTGQVKVVQAGEAITQGNAIYLNSDGKYYKANVTSATASVAAGIALTKAAADADYLVIAEDGCTVDLGATLTVGETYVVSASGAISPIGDLTSNDYPCILGTATAADALPLNINASGVQVP